MKSLVEQKLHKILNAKFVEAQLDEDYPISFDRKSFKQLKSFKDRVLIS